MCVCVSVGGESSSVCWKLEHQLRSVIRPNPKTSSSTKSFVRCLTMMLESHACPLSRKALNDTMSDRRLTAGLTHCNTLPNPNLWVLYPTYTKCHSVNRSGLLHPVAGLCSFVVYFLLLNEILCPHCKRHTCVHLVNRTERCFQS